MRLSALLILTQLLLLVSVVHADPMADRFVELLQDVCVSPATPEGIIEAGNRRAAAEGWKLIESGPAPMRLVDPFNGPKLSFESSWMTSLPDAPIARLLISIVRPEIPGVRSNVCMVEPAAAIDPGELARTLERRFGPLIIRATRQLSGSHKWFFTAERERGNCGRWIILSERPRVGLTYRDGAYPNDGNWSISRFMVCRP